MSPKWIRDRLDDAVGEDLADEIARNHEASILRIDKNGTVSEKSLANRTWRDEDL